MAHSLDNLCLCKSGRDWRGGPVRPPIRSVGNQFLTHPCQQTCAVRACGEQLRTPSCQGLQQLRLLPTSGSQLGSCGSPIAIDGITWVRSGSLGLARRGNGRLRHVAEVVVTSRAWAVGHFCWLCCLAGVLPSFATLSAIGRPAKLGERPELHARILRLAIGAALIAHRQMRFTRPSVRPLPCDHSRWASPMYWSSCGLVFKQHCRLVGDDPV